MAIRGCKMKTFGLIQTWLILVLLLCSFLAFGSCAGISEVVPAIAFTNPPGTAYVPGDVTVAVSVSNFNLVDNQNQTAIRGEGRLRYMLDGQTGTATDLADESNPVMQAVTRSQTYTFHNVPTGTHRISVELVNNNLAKLNPPVGLSMTVVVFQLPVTPGATAEASLPVHQALDPTQPIIRRETALIK